MKRSQIQDQINEICKTPNLTSDQIRSRLSLWLDSQGVIITERDRILEDFNSYETYIS